MTVSEILRFYEEDFVNPKQAVSLLEYINHFRKEKIPSSYSIGFIKYDWAIIAIKKLELGLRYFIASVLLLTGIGKLLNVLGFIEVINTYKIIPTFIQPAIVVLMVLVELKIAENLFR